MMYPKRNLDGPLKMAEAMIAAGNYPAAKQVLSQYLRWNPNDPEALNLNGVALFRSGDAVGAEAMYRRMVKVAPRDSRASYNLALALLKQGRVNEARTWLGTALTVNPGLERARQQLAKLDAQASPAAPQKKNQARTVPDIKKEEVNIEEHLDAGQLLRSGTRRVTSFAGRFVFSAILVFFGLFYLYQCGTGVECSGMGLASMLTFPNPNMIQRQLDVVRGMPGTELLQRKLIQGQVRSAEIAEFLESTAIFLSVVALIAGILLALHALVAAGRTRYDIYERRIDVAEGVLNRHRKSAWLYEIKDVEFRQPFFLNVTGNGMIRLRLEDDSVLKVTGFGSARDQERLWEELTNSVLKERRVLRHWWV